MLNAYSVALYAAESWTSTKADRKRLAAFEVWIWRTMLTISWKDLTNASVLEKVDEDTHA